MANAILKQDIYTPYDLYYRKAGMEVEVLKTGLIRDELDMTTFKPKKVEEVLIKYPYFSWTFKDGRTETVFHECTTLAENIHYGSTS